MKVLDEGWERPGPSAVTIGVFDGVHRGHTGVLSEVGARARAGGLRVGVLTFVPHPVQVLAPHAAPSLLTTPERRFELLKDAGADWVGVLDLADIRTMEPEDFVSDVLVDRAAARAVVVGGDFRFGHDRRGDLALLVGEGRRHGFEAVGLDLVADGGEVISSSRIRRLLARGDVAAAAVLLGRPHRVTGPVVHGEARGRTLDYPTANLLCPAGLAMPADGIYAARANGMEAVASLGVRPTFGEGGTRLLEVHVFDFGGDLYGETLDVDFVTRLRGEERFDTVEDLVAQMDRDSVAARRALGSSRF